MFNKFKGTIDGIKERAGEIADETSEANAQKYNEQRMAAADEREAAKELAKANLSGDRASKVMVLGANMLNRAIAASKTVKAVSGELSSENPAGIETPAEKPQPDKTEKHKSIVDKVPDWM